MVGPKHCLKCWEPWPKALRRPYKNITCSVCLEEKKRRQLRRILDDKGTMEKRIAKVLAERAAMTPEAREAQGKRDAADLWG